MRTTTLLLAALLLPTGCADAPITPEHILPNGQLRADYEHAAFSAQATPVMGRAVAVQVAAVLATQATGALEDAATFTAEAGAVHLHLRADGLVEARPVTFVWTFGETREEVPGVLAPTTTLALAASHPIGPEQRGRWRVEVYAVGGEPPQLLFQREFEVL